MDGKGRGREGNGTGQTPKYLGIEPPLMQSGLTEEMQASCAAVNTAALYSGKCAGYANLLRSRNCGLQIVAIRLPMTFNNGVHTADDKFGEQLGNSHS